MKQKILKFVLLIVMLGMLLILTGCGSSSSNSTSSSSKPSDLELMSYAQTVLQDEYGSSITYSRKTSDYNFVETGLRYKIEGEFTKNGIDKDFYMIIEFTDNTYTEYDLISLDTK